MKKRILVLLMITAVTLSFGGCGMPEAGGDGERTAERATESSITGNVKSDDGEKNTSGKRSGSAGELTDPFVTENCIYSVAEWQDSLVCTDLQGKHKKKYDLPSDEWDTDGEKVRVGKEHICYEKKGDLYVSPIRQKKTERKLYGRKRKRLPMMLMRLSVFRSLILSMLMIPCTGMTFGQRNQSPWERKESMISPFFAIISG